MDDDEDEEEDFYAENDSDDEFHISDSKKRKLPAKSKNSVQKKKPNIGEISNRNTTKGKGRQLSVDCCQLFKISRHEKVTRRILILLNGSLCLGPEVGVLKHGVPRWLEDAILGLLFLLLD